MTEALAARRDCLATSATENDVLRFLRVGIEDKSSFHQFTVEEAKYRYADAMIAASNRQQYRNRYPELARQKETMSDG